MRYLQYLASAVVVGGGLYLLLSIAFDFAYAAKMAAVTAPLALWTGRLITAYRTSVITRRMPMLDGGPTRAGAFWSFRPDVYERRPGFDYFKGYFVKEAAVLALLWLLFLSIPLMELLAGAGLVERQPL